MPKTKAAIIGASGYTGEELVRLMSRHPSLELAAVTSRQHAGKRAADIYPYLRPPQDLVFSNPSLAELPALAEVFFLALPHGESMHHAAPLLEAGRTVIDLSADFRIKDRERYRQYYKEEAPAEEWLQRAVYGSPETNASALQGAKLVACPGCYPTSVLLALAPALMRGWVRPDSVVVNALSGTSGAGRKADVSLLFSECNESVKPYGVGTHRHVPEIEQELSRVSGAAVIVQFTPHLLPITRGMLSSVVAAPSGALPSQQEVDAAYAEFCSTRPFVRYCAGELPEIRRVVQTNRCDVAARVDTRTGRLLFFSVIDNLTKGASGQALQCWNLIAGRDETEGLPL